MWSTWAHPVGLTFAKEPARGVMNQLAVHRNSPISIIIKISDK